MTVRDALLRVWRDPVDMWYYVQGSVRYLVYTRWPRLIRPHIRAQYEARKILAQKCYRAGSCRCCGCRTPELFFAAKGCGITTHAHCALMGAPCYEKMLGRADWNKLKQNLAPRG